jgi:TolA-binding protein
MTSVHHQVVVFVLLSIGTSASARTVVRPNQQPVARQAASEATLSAVRHSDAAARDSKGTIAKLSATEHMRRAAVYNSNRAFEEARAHWQALINYYPQDSRIPEALLGIGKSYFLAKDYNDGYPIFNRLAQDYPATKEGREGLNYSAASLLRLERFTESAARYAEYCDRYPNGERIDTAHLNVIDTLREANKPKDALVWVTRTRRRFAGGPVETNAIFAALRLHVAEGNWNDAIAAAEELSRRSFSKAVAASTAQKSLISRLSVLNKQADEMRLSLRIWQFRTVLNLTTVGWRAGGSRALAAGRDRAELVAMT